MLSAELPNRITVFHPVAVKADHPVGTEEIFLKFLMEIETVFLKCCYFGVDEIKLDLLTGVYVTVVGQIVVDADGIGGNFEPVCQQPDRFVRLNFDGADEQIVSFHGVGDFQVAGHGQILLEGWLH